MFNLPPNQFDRAKWETHRGGRNEGSTVAQLPIDPHAITGFNKTFTSSGPIRYENSPHLVFEANPGGETAPGQDIGVPRGYFNPKPYMQNMVAHGNPGQGRPFEYSNYMNQQGDAAPAGTAPAGQAPAGTAPAGTAGAPQGINANALMTAPTQWGERRDPVIPLQGYQNALLRGF